MSFEIKWLAKGLVVEFEGNVTIGDINAMNEVLYNDVRFESCLYQMFDFISADLSGIKIAELTETARNDAEMSQEFPTPAVAIVSQQPVGGALAYHYKMLAEAHGMVWEIQIFRTMSDAEKWCERFG